MSENIQKDDYTKMKKFIDNMKKQKRDARKRTIKNIGVNVVKKFKAPQYKTYAEGPKKDEYKLDDSGNKIRATHKTRKGKLIKETRKLVSFKDFMNNFDVEPKSTADTLQLNNETITKDQAIQALNAIIAYYHLCGKNYNVNEMIQITEQAIKNKEQGLDQSTTTPNDDSSNDNNPDNSDNDSGNDNVANGNDDPNNNSPYMDPNQNFESPE